MLHYTMNPYFKKWVATMKFLWRAMTDSHCVLQVKAKRKRERCYNAYFTQIF